MSDINTGSLDPDASSYKFYPKHSPIQTIRSMHNNQVLSVSPQKTGTHTYAIKINDKCLNVYKDSYDMRHCAQPDEDVHYHPQYFEAKRIMNVIDAEKYKGPTTEDHGASGSYGTSYPYTLFVHKNTRQCLNLDDEGAFMAQCDPDNTRQHWQVSDKIHSCNLA